MTNTEYNRHISILKAERIDYAAGAVIEYRSSKCEGDTSDPIIKEDISDLICDLYHLADSLGYNIDEILTTAKAHHVEEKKDYILLK